MPEQYTTIVVKRDRSLRGLVRDHEYGVRHLPLRLGLRFGAAKVLWGTILVTAAVLGGLLAAGAQVGLRQ